MRKKSEIFRIVRNNKIYFRSGICPLVYDLPDKNILRSYEEEQVVLKALNRTWQHKVGLRFYWPRGLWWPRYIWLTKQIWKYKLKGE